MLVVGVCLGPYELLALLGKGGMGEVWRALDTRLGREVALKTLPEAFASDAKRLERFRQEARTLAAMSHPNLDQVFEAGEWEGVPYLVMELLEGETLRDRMQGKPMPPRHAAEVARDIAYGLAAAHEKGILHRDLKPENLFITRDGRVKVLDFGLAKMQGPRADRGADPEEGATTLSEPGQVMGTPGYLSPEQVRGELVDPRSDLFSLGVVLWEMVAGGRPFQGDSTIEIMHAILKQNPWNLPEASKLPPALEGILRRCLAKAPEDRFPSASDLASALQAALDVTGSAGWADPLTPGRGGRGSRVRRAGLLAVPILVALGLAIALKWQPWSKGLARPPSVVALPARVLGSPESAFLTDAIPDTLSTLLAGVEGIDTRCPPSSIEFEQVRRDTAKVAEAYGVDLLLVTTVTVQGEHLVLNAQLVEARTHRVRWGSQLEGSRGAYNDLIRRAAVGATRAMRPPGAPSAVLPGPAFSSEIELALREGRHLGRRYGSTWKEADFDSALAALQRAQSMDPTSATLAAELGALFGAKDVRALDPDSHQQAKLWADRALELDPRCGLAWAVLCWHEANKPGKADPDKLAEYALKAVALSPGDVRGHVALAAIAPTMQMAMATGSYMMELDPLEYAGYEATAYGLMDTGRPAEALLLLEKALRLQLPERRSNNWGLSVALFKLGRNEEALKVYTPGWGWDGGLLGEFMRGDPAAIRRRGIEVITRWRTKEGNPWYWANRAYFVAPLLVRAGLREEALWLLLKAAETRGPMNLDLALQDPGLRQLKGDPRYHQALQAYREYALSFLEHAKKAEAQGNLPSYLKPSIEELQVLVKKPI